MCFELSVENSCIKMSIYKSIRTIQYKPDKTLSYSERIVFCLLFKIFLLMLINSYNVDFIV